MIVVNVVVEVGTTVVMKWSDDVALALVLLKMLSLLEQSKVDVLMLIDFVVVVIAENIWSVGTWFTGRISMDSEVGMVWKVGVILAISFSRENVDNKGSLVVLTVVSNNVLLC